MAWRYTFDNGPEKALDITSTLYSVAAMAAFAREDVRQFPTINVPGFERYRGHVLALWDDELLPVNGKYLYGIGYNQCGGLTISVLSKK